MEQRDFRHSTALAGALAGALLVTGCGLLPGGDAADEAGSTAEASALSGVRDTADRLLTAAREGLGLATPAPPAAPAATQAARIAPPRPAPRAVERAPEPAPPALPAVAPETPLAFAPVPPLPSAPAPLVEPAMPEPVASPSHPLYSSVDNAVQPPAWRSVAVSRPQLAGSASHLPALELIVARDGSVERARLLRGSRQLPDMMILSSAKMWQFEPAVLDGEPVRYRLIVRLNEPEALE